MQNIVWKLILIVVVIGGCIWAAYPPEERIRLGKDLRGGTSLIYQVTIPDDAGDRQEILAQTIEVLKERINPTGVLDISMQPLGNDRIEIVMPLPNEQVKALRDEYTQALKQLQQMAEVRSVELDEALRQNSAVARFGGEAGSSRAQSLSALQDAYNRFHSSLEALEEARQSGAEGNELDRMEQAAADAQFEFEQARDSIRKTNLDQARVVRTLNLPTRPVKSTDATGLETVGPSPREVALTSLRTEFPHLSDQIDRTVAAYDAYQAKRTTLDDPEDLMRLLRGAGVLEFRIAVQPNKPEGVNIDQMRQQLRDVGPEKADSSVARWFPINDLKQWYNSPELLAALEADPEGYFAGRNVVAAEFEGRHYLLLYTTRAKCMTHQGDVRWTIVGTGITQDELGRPAVSFRLDQSGGSLMSRLTGPHVGQPMAIVLDGQVYSAPNLMNAIGNSGVIQGDFSTAEIGYLTRVLAAGALGARLSEQPIAINTLGPTIGQDNLNRGLQACLWSVVAVVVFMLVYYFQAGIVANIAVLANAIIIFGVMALIDGTFTLPGLAGIALTIGMAVDANILIYERIREELTAGETNLKHAIRLGYSKALSTIVDANLTNLIVCVVLLYTATTEVKGFATTLMIGIAGTLFTALFMTRQIYYICTDVFGWKRMPMLATTVPAVHRLLSPNVNWIGLRTIFIPISIVLVVGSWILIGMRGVQIFDTEFRGGITATMRTAIDPETNRPILLKHVDVERRIIEIGRSAESNLPPSEHRDVLAELRNADVLTVGETVVRDRELLASGFQIKVALPPNVTETASFKDEIVQAIIDEMGPLLDVIPPLEFAGHDANRHDQYTYPISADTLGAVINRSQYRQNISAYRGGVAIVLDQLSPPATTEDIQRRIERMREQPDFGDATGRDVQVIGLEAVDRTDPTKGYTSAVVLVSDPAIDYTRVDFEVWDGRLAAREWSLIGQALARPPTFEQVSEFSSAVAATLRASAVVAVTLSLICILVYIWVRFGSLRYSAGAIAALVHDVSIGLGLLAFSQLVGETSFAKALLIESFHIDMGVIAAILTLIGYSLNDTIVVLDRIRENRGRLLIATAEIVNNSINQTFSRTMLTGITTIISLLILYVEGGTGIRAFAFVMLVGMVVGVYSSVAIAAPLVFKGHSKPESGDGLQAPDSGALTV